VQNATSGRLDTKVVIAFGAGQGIGRGCALVMASQGATVVVADINTDTAKSVVGEIEGRGARGAAAACDVTDRDQVQSAIEVAVGGFGRLDGIVNLAVVGSNGCGMLEDMRVEDLRTQLEITVVGMYNTMTLSLPHLKERGGSIVNFSSGAAIEGTAGLAAYAAAKQGVRGLGLAAANEWGAYQVRVNAVCPLAMSPSVPVYFSTRPEGEYEASMAKVPLGRYGDPEADIGGAVAFLMSDDARFVTGQTIMLDGGQTHL
jgi:2-hydroxycyclohexanecarboxyl-CoA dehydrogenase